MDNNRKLEGTQKRVYLCYSAITVKQQVYPGTQQTTHSGTWVTNYPDTAALTTSCHVPFNTSPPCPMWDGIVPAVLIFGCV